MTVDGKEPDHHAEAVQDGVSDNPALANEQAAPSRNTLPTTPQQERLDRPKLTQRLMAKTLGRAPVPPAEMVSAVDQQQLMRLAAQGNASAQNQLGQFYANGRGVPQDYSIARKWYEKAAAQGHGWAQNQLGQLSADELGGLQDYKQAHHWWEQAATHGIAQAQYNLGQLYANGRGGSQNYAAARGWYEKAAAQGHTWARLNSDNSMPTDKVCRRTMRWHENGTRKPPLRATRGRRLSSRCCS